MKKIVLFAYSLTVSLNAWLQPVKDPGYTGFDKFILGKPKTEFENSLHWLEKYTKDGHVFDLYSYTSPAGLVQIAGVGFGTVILIFNDSNQLSECGFTKFYRKQDIPRHQKQAESDYKKISDELTKQTGHEGEKKPYIKNNGLLQTGREWPGARSILTIKETLANNHSVIDVSFSYID